MDFSGDSPLLQAIGQYGYKVYDNADMVIMYLHLLASALFPIYIGSHASLRCPPGDICIDAKKLAAAKKSFEGAHHEDDDDDEQVENTIEGLTPSDAVLFPILAACTLGGLYYLIKWLKDPAILNKILGYYFSTIGIFGTGKLAADGFNVFTTYIFPAAWASGSTAYIIDPVARTRVVGSSVTTIKDNTNSPWISQNSNPFPGVISKLRLPKSLNSLVWSIRDLVTERWLFKAHVHGVFTLKNRVRLNDITGILIGLISVFVYNYYDKAWWLTNLMAFGLCYGTLQLMSPTTFWTGSLVLMGLFVYDVVMVFYTPMMVTVATTLDVPIKLVFPTGSKRGGMLGLGDVVLPGIMMAIALRFDLYMFYLKQKRNMSDSTIPAQGNAPHKPVYYSATGHQGERYWTSPSMFSSSSSPSPDSLKSFLGGKFPKTYFHASVAGYVAGMIVTLYIMNVYKHAQPALLYLVPGVLGSLWGTSLIRGEFWDMWGYREDGGVLDELKGKKPEEQLKTGDGTNTSKSEEIGQTTTEESLVVVDEDKTKQKGKEDLSRQIFAFSLSRPSADFKTPEILKELKPVAA